MDTHRLALKPGYVLEHFRIERVLGKGGFGITYLAVDVRLGKRVAIKELLPDTIATRVEGSTVGAHSVSLEEDWQWAKDRFVEEAQMLAGFSHPAIVGVQMLTEANGTVYMVMDYVEGESYEARLRRIRAEPDEDSLMAVISPVLQGLEEVHAKGLLHRDIKPENILIKNNGQPVLIDFGAARESVGKTVTMTSMVTHGYSPIEQYQSKGKMGPWTDIYAVGAVMCRAMTGEKPPVATERIEDDEFVWLMQREMTGFDEEFRKSVDWALQVKSQERPKLVGVFIHAVRPASGKLRGASPNSSESHAKTSEDSSCSFAEEAPAEDASSQPRDNRTPRAGAVAFDIFQLEWRFVLAGLLTGLPIGLLITGIGLPAAIEKWLVPLIMVGSAILAARLWTKSELKNWHVIAGLASGVVAHFIAESLGLQNLPSFLLPLVAVWSIVIYMKIEKIYQRL